MTFIVLMCIFFSLSYFPNILTVSDERKPKMPGPQHYKSIWLSLQCIPLSQSSRSKQNPAVLSLLSAFSSFNSHYSIIYTFPVCRHGNGHVCSGDASISSTDGHEVYVSYRGNLMSFYFSEVTSCQPIFSNPAVPLPAQTAVIALSTFNRTKLCMRSVFIL